MQVIPQLFVYFFRNFLSIYSATFDFLHSNSQKKAFGLLPKAIIIIVCSQITFVQELVFP